MWKLGKLTQLNTAFFFFPFLIFRCFSKCVSSYFFCVYDHDLILAEVILLFRSNIIVYAAVSCTIPLTFFAENIYKKETVTNKPGCRFALLFLDCRSCLRVSWLRSLGDLLLCLISVCCQVSLSSPCSGKSCNYSCDLDTRVHLNFGRSLWRFGS